MRNVLDGLAALIQEHMKTDPFPGHRGNLRDALTCLSSGKSPRK
jgi:hypothetical protein